MDLYESEEWDFEDTMIYDVIRLEDLPAFLEDLGYKTRKIGTSYLTYGYYKHIFHFALCHHYDDHNIFKNDIGMREYVPYNSLLIDENVNVENTAKFLIDLFNKIEGTLCIFIDIHSKDPVEKVGHTTLLIYRKNLNRIEYFDSNGVGIYGYSDILKNIIDIVIFAFPGITLMKSKEINGLSEYSIAEASARSLNGRCGISKPKSIEGWCQMWSLLLYELIRKYPEMETKYIIRVLYSTFDNKNYVDASVSLNNLMKGFYRIIIGRTNMILRDFSESGNKWNKPIKNVASPRNKSRSNPSNESIEIYHSFSVNIDDIYIKANVLENYDPKHILNDAALESLIDDQMDPYCLLDGSFYKMNN